VGFRSLAFSRQPNRGSFCAFWFLCCVTPVLVGDETGENALLGVEGFWLFLCSLIFFVSQTEHKVICLSFIFVISLCCISP
jgi:hypothetical protein